MLRSVRTVLSLACRELVATSVRMSASFLEDLLFISDPSLCTRPMDCTERNKYMSYF